MIPTGFEPQAECVTKAHDIIAREHRKLEEAITEAVIAFMGATGLGVQKIRCDEDGEWRCRIVYAPPPPPPHATLDAIPVPPHRCPRCFHSRSEFRTDDQRCGHYELGEGARVPVRCDCACPSPE